MPTRRSLDLLDVKVPCPEHWDTMAGDARARHCAKCSHNVVNLSAMTEDEAKAWLAGRTGHVCVRIDRDPRGRILFALGAMALVAACSSPSETPVDAGAHSPPAAAPSVEKPVPPPPRHTLGCVCLSGDPLCSCL